MDKNLYVTVAKSVKAALPHIHLHAFSPEEIIYGAKRNKISVMEMIRELKAAGVDSFPGKYLGRFFLVKVLVMAIRNFDAATKFLLNLLHFFNLEFFYFFKYD